MKKLFSVLILLLSLLQATQTFAQVSIEIIDTVNSKKDYIYMKGKDTIFCTILTINRHQNGNVHCIKYMDADNKEHVIGTEKSSKAGIAECEKVLSLRIMGYRMDIMPEYGTSGEKYHREVITAGPITLYCTIELTAKINNKNERVLFFKYGAATKYVKYPDGTVTWGWKKEALEKYFSKCSGFSYDKNFYKHDPCNVVKEYNKAGCK